MQRIVDVGFVVLELGLLLLDRADQTVRPDCRAKSMNVVVPPKAAARPPGFGVLGAHRRRERDVEMDMRIDPAGHDIFAVSVDDAGQP